MQQNKCSQNAAKCSQKHEHITSVLTSLHWLPKQSRIRKILLMYFKYLHALAPSYITDIIHPYVGPSDPPVKASSRSHGPGLSKKVTEPFCCWHHPTSEVALQLWFSKPGSKLTHLISSARLLLTLLITMKAVRVYLVFHFGLVFLKKKK